MKKNWILVAMTVLLLTPLFANGSQEKGTATPEEPAAKEQTYVFKYAHTQSDNHPRSVSMTYFKKKLEEATNGRIQVELYFNGVLGKEAEVFDMVKMGTVQGSRGGLFERANKMFLIYTLPFMFENKDQVLNAMNSDFGAKVNAGAKANGLYIPATGVAGGFRNITNSVRPIASVDDLKGLKMRTPPIDMTLKTFNTLGANPQQVAYTETYMALKSGVVDGQENPFSNAVDMKFYEAQKYLSVVNWQVHPDPFYVSPDFYNSLSEDLKSIFDMVAEDAMQYSNTIWLASEDEYLETLKQHLEVNSITAEARAGFIKAAKPVYQSYVDDGYFTWDEIEELQAFTK